MVIESVQKHLLLFDRRLVLFSKLEEAFDAIMGLLIRSGDSLFACAAGKLDKLALVLPVGQQRLSVSHGAAKRERAPKLLACALLEVLSKIAVLKSCRTLSAVEAAFIKHVHHEAVWLASGGVGRSAVWTVFLFARPILDAWLAVELVALPALDHIRCDDIQADRACKKGVKRLVAGILWSK